MSLGLSSSALLTSITSPLAGMIRSEAAYFRHIYVNDISESFLSVVGDAYESVAICVNGKILVRGGEISFHGCYFFEV